MEMSVMELLAVSREMQGTDYGWRGYGDPEYVSHVLRFYAGGNLFAGLFGNRTARWCRW